MHENIEDILTSAWKYEIFSNKMKKKVLFLRYVSVEGVLDQIGDCNNLAWITCCNV